MSIWFQYLVFVGMAEVFLDKCVASSDSGMPNLISYVLCAINCIAIIESLQSVVSESFSRYINQFSKITVLFVKFRHMEQRVVHYPYLWCSDEDCNCTNSMQPASHLH